MRSPFRRMPGAFFLDIPASEIVMFALAGALAILLAWWGYDTWKRRRISPEARERGRRALLASAGKLGDATLLEFRDNLIFYCYSARGVEYTASQDVSTLREFVPAVASVSAPVAVKYDPRNPANSIVLSEEWSGLR